MMLTYNLLGDRFCQAELFLRRFAVVGSQRHPVLVGVLQQDAGVALQPAVEVAGEVRRESGGVGPAVAGQAGLGALQRLGKLERPVGRLGLGRLKSKNAK